jgi:hypothetical protein
VRIERGAKVAACSVCLAVGCYSGQPDARDDSASGDSSADDGASDGADDDTPIPEEDANEVGVSGLRRLSIVEFEQTIVDLLGFEVAQAKELLPADTYTPFDNDFTLQTPSEPLIEGLEIVAGDIAEAVIADLELRAAIVPCEPSGADDAECLRQFVSSFGRRALRRPLTDTEIETFVSLQSHGIEAGDFWVGVGAVLRALLQHPEFVYRVEIGEPVLDQPGLFRLNDHEVGARLSYFLIGSTPPDWLLDAADAGELGSTDEVAQAAATLLEDDRVRARVNRFHALWLSYENLSVAGIYGDMHGESDALVQRIVFDDARPWTDMLTSTQTYVTPELAAHYGLPAPAGAAGWVDYGDSGRAGLLSHGAFLSVGAKFGDTSPTQRGLLVRTKLFCTEIPKPPPDLMVDVCAPPPADPDACKHERYFMSTEPACSACHMLMDPIGFGLENYDASGAFRETDIDRPDCVIDGQGEFAGVGTFSGPAELGALAVESGAVEACVARQLYRFAVGRTELDEHDDAFLARLVEDASTEDGMHMLPWITQYVSSEAFRHRREEESP